MRKAVRIPDREAQGGECRRFPDAPSTCRFSSVSLVFSLSSGQVYRWGSRACLERDKDIPRSPLSGASSRVTLRGIVRGFTDDAVDAVCEDAPDNTGPEVIRLNERAGRSNLSPE